MSDSGYFDDAVFVSYVQATGSWVTLEPHVAYHQRLMHMTIVDNLHSVKHVVTSLNARVMCWWAG